MNSKDIVNRHDHLDRAYSMLKIGFVIAPVVAGVDKFFNFLTDWTQYLAPVFYETVNLNPATFMMVVGVIEIIAGIGVLFKPQIFGNIVGAWLIGIIINLLLLGEYYDIILRDLGLSIGAFALGQLALRFEERHKRLTSREEKKDRSYTQDRGGDLSYQ